MLDTVVKEWAGIEPSSPEYGLGCGVACAAGPGQALRRQQGGAPGVHTNNTYKKAKRFCLNSTGSQKSLHS